MLYKASISIQTRVCRNKEKEIPIKPDSMHCLFLFDVLYVEGVIIRDALLNWSPANVTVGRRARELRVHNMCAICALFFDDLFLIREATFSNCNVRDKPTHFS